LSGKPSPAPDRAPSTQFVPQPPGRLRRSFLRYAIRFFVGSYLRVRHENFETLPQPPYLLVFKHPSWVDPFLLASHWPVEHTLFIFGPKEEDINTGWKNALIRWSHMAVPFRPSKTDLIDTTRRATSVLKSGYVLALAGEGRLSDTDAELVPVQEGAAFFALRGGAPIVPMAIIGAHWLRFGKTLTMRVGPVIELRGRRADRDGVASLTVEVQAALERLIEGVVDEPPPGRFGRWMTDALAERPWLSERAAADASDDPPQAHGDERR
jgi:1-acyl-sn-glycerol-3-phosphate acyltransferase